MTKKWIGINILLLLIAVLSGWALNDSVKQFKAENDLNKIEPDPAQNQRLAQDTSLPAPLTANFRTSGDFSVISEKNVFSESRTKEDSADTPVTTGSIPASQKPKLVGVILAGNQKIASLQEPQVRGRAVQTQVLRLGDSYEGYRIAEIESDHVVLDNGRQKEIVTLTEDSQTTQRSRATAKKTPRIIPIGALSTAAAGNTPIIVGSSGPTGPTRSTAARTTPQTATTPQAANAAALEALRNIVLPAAGGGLPAAQQPAAQQNEQQPSTQAPAAAPNTGAAQRRTRVIRSPFGDITRDP